MLRNCFWWAQETLCGAEIKSGLVAGKANGLPAVKSIAKAHGPCFEQLFLAAMSLTAELDSLHGTGLTVLCNLTFLMAEMESLLEAH